MARTLSVKRLQQEILKTWQAASTETFQQDTPPAISTTYHKSTSMRLVETHFGVPIEELISIDKNGKAVARRLGVSTSCVSKWRKQLGILPKRGRPVKKVVDKVI